MGFVVAFSVVAVGCFVVKNNVLKNLKIWGANEKEMICGYEKKTPKDNAWLKTFF